MIADSTYKLLQFKEKLKENLSSSQIAGTLDQLIFNTIYPFVKYTKLVDVFIAEILPYIIFHSRRKLSTTEKPLLYGCLLEFLISNDTKRRMFLLKKANIERSIYFSMFNWLEHRVKLYYTNLGQLIDNPADPVALQSLKNLEKELYYTNTGLSLHGILREYEYWFKHTIEFKNMIIEKYVRFAYTQAARAKSNTNMVIDTDDLFKDLILSVSRAIDKYDAKKGTLTQYITWWIFDGITNTKNPHQYGVAFTIPTGQRKKLTEGVNKTFSNLSVSLTDLMNDEEKADQNNDFVDKSSDILDDIIKRQDWEICQQVAICADKTKLASLLNGFKIKLTPDEEQLLRKTVKSSVSTKT